MSWLIYIWLLFNCHSSGSKHAGPLIFCCPSLLPYCLLMTTAPHPRSAACKVLSFMILVMTNWKPSSWLCLVYKWRFFCVGSHHTDDINSLFLCIPWWIRIIGLLLCQVSPPEQRVLIGDQFCTFQLSVSEVAIVGPGRWSQVCRSCFELLDRSRNRSQPVMKS